MRDARGNILADALAAPPLIGCHSDLLLPLLLLPGDGPRWPFPRARIGMGALPTDGKPAPVPESTVATQIHEPLDVYCHLAAPVALNAEISVNNLADAGDFGLAQFVDATLGRDAHPLANVTRT